MIRRLFDCLSLSPARRHRSAAGPSAPGRGDCSGCAPSTPPSANSSRCFVHCLLLQREKSSQHCTTETNWRPPRPREGCGMAQQRAACAPVPVALRSCCFRHRPSVPAVRGTLRPAPAPRVLLIAESSRVCWSDACWREGKTEKERGHTTSTSSSFTSRFLVRYGGSRCMIQTQLVANRQRSYDNSQTRGRLLNTQL